MLELRSAGAQEGDVYLNGAAGFAGCAITGKSLVAYSLGILVLDDLPSENDKTSYRIGSLFQGQTLWGRLNDKDVLHTHVDGEINVSHSVAASFREWPSQDDVFVMGRTSIGEVSVSTGPIYRFGESAYSTRCYTVPGGYVVGRATDVLPSVQSITDIVKSEGDVCFISSRYNGATLCFADGSTPSTIGPGLIYAGILCRDRSTSVVRRITLTDVDGVAYRDPWGVIYDTWEKVPLSYDEWEGKGVVAAYHRYSDLFDPDIVPEYPISQSEIVGRASLALRKTFPVVLALDETTYDPDVLTSDILSQHTVSDSSILLDFFQLNPKMLSGFDWKNLFRLSKAVSKAVAKGQHRRPGFRKDLIHLLQTGAGTFLGFKYGVLPNFRDLCDVWASFEPVALARMQSNRLHSRHIQDGKPAIGSLRSTFTMTVEVDRLARDFLPLPMQLLAAFNRFGFWPDFSMALDAIPFSFVLDWFTSIGDTARSLDSWLWKDYYPIQYCIQGRKDAWTVACQDLWPDIPELEGTLTFVNYLRVISPELPDPPTLVVSESDGVDHTAEAGALIVTRIRV